MKDQTGTQNVDNVTHEKDLGVIFDSELSFNQHIATKVKRANQALGTIKKTFTYLDKDIFLPLYKAYVRPHLEYASVVWSPIFKKDIIAIEQVQRRATRIVPGMKNLSYEERLKTLGLPTLQYRRERADVLQVYKILHEYEEINLNSGLPLSDNVNTRGHSLKLEKVRAQNRSGQNRFRKRVVNNWNGLSDITVTASSVNSFKSQLNTDWKNKPNKFE